MSKSVGNVVDPDDLVHGTARKMASTEKGNNGKGKQQKQQQKKKKLSPAEEAAASGYGADVCRIWAAASNYKTDVTIGATSVCAVLMTRMF